MAPLASHDECASQYQLLWHDVFGDDREFIGDVFGRVGADMLRPVYIMSGSIVLGAALLVPYQLRLPEGNASAYYLYGVLTRTEYRNRGICTDLLEKARRQAVDDGKDYCFLSPATKDLEEFYKRRGYSAACAAEPSVPIGDADMSAYNASLPTPCIQHTPADWSLACKHFAAGHTLPCQLLSLRGLPLPTRLHTPALLS